MSSPLRRRGDDGVAIVEMALVLPVLVVLLLGLFTGALAWNQSQALGQGARVAARYASTLPMPVPAAGQTEAEVEVAWLEDLAHRAVAAAEGDMDSGVPGRRVCVAYVDPRGALGGSSDRTMSLVLDPTGATTVGTSPCFDDEQGPTAKRVQLELRRDGHIDTGLYRFPLSIRRTAVYRYEADRGL